MKLDALRKALAEPMRLVVAKPSFATETELKFVENIGWFSLSPHKSHHHIRLNPELARHVRKDSSFIHEDLVEAGYSGLDAHLEVLTTAVRRERRYSLVIPNNRNRVCRARQLVSGSLRISVPISKEKRGLVEGTTNIETEAITLLDKLILYHGWPSGIEVRPVLGRTHWEVRSIDGTSDLRTDPHKESVVLDVGRGADPLFCPSSAVPLRDEEGLP